MLTVLNTKVIKYRLKLQKIKAKEAPAEEAAEVVLTVETNVPADLAAEDETVEIAVDEETETEEVLEAAKMAIKVLLTEVDSEEKAILTETQVTAADAEEEIHTKTYTTE